MSALDLGLDSIGDLLREVTAGGPSKVLKPRPLQKDEYVRGFRGKRVRVGMRRLMMESWSLLLYFEWIMQFRGFRRLHQVVERERTSIKLDGGVSSHELCHAIDLACVFYFKRVLCLQRSAATTMLLRRHGWNAEMVIGAKLIPFESHAWVEIEGCVVNDRSYMPEIYQVLERC